MKAYIISADTAPERRSFQLDQTRRIGLDDVEFFRALTPNDLDEGTLAKLGRSWQRQMKPAEIACFLSHRALWREVSNSNEPALILEDDAVLVRDVAEILRNLEGLRSFDRVNLEARLKKKIVGKRRLVIGSYVLMELRLDRSGSAGYVLWPSGAEKLLAAFEHRAALADKAHRHLRLSSYQLEPAAVVPLDYCKPLGITPPSGIRTDSTISRPRTGASPIGASGVLRCRWRRAIEQARTLSLQAKSVWTAESRAIEVDPSRY